MREEFKAKKAQWDNEKGAIGKVQKLREDLEAANAALEKAQPTVSIFAKQEGLTAHARSIDIRFDPAVVGKENP